MLSLRNILFVTVAILFTASAECVVEWSHGDCVVITFDRSEVSQPKCVELLESAKNTSPNLNKEKLARELGIIQKASTGACLSIVIRDSKIIAIIRTVLTLWVLNQEMIFSDVDLASQDLKVIRDQDQVETGKLLKKPESKL